MVCLQAGLLTGFFSRAVPAVRNRLLLDPRFLFKVGVEVGIDAGMALLVCYDVRHVFVSPDDCKGDHPYKLPGHFVD